jgi:hypothetical protein
VTAVTAVTALCHDPTPFEVSASSTGMASSP